MPSREQKSDLSVAYSVEPQAIAAPANGDGVDLRGFDAAMIEVRYGDTVNAGTLFTIQDSDDNISFTTLTPAAKPDLDVTLLGPDTPVAAVANTSYKAAYVGKKRYVRVDLPTVPAATDVVALVVRGIPALGAVTD